MIVRLIKRKKEEKHLFKKIIKFSLAYINSCECMHCLEAAVYQVMTNLSWKRMVNL